MRKAVRQKSGTGCPETTKRLPLIRTGNIRDLINEKPNYSVIKKSFTFHQMNINEKEEAE